MQSTSTTTTSIKQLDDRLYGQHKDQYNISLHPFLQARAREIASLEHSLVMQESSKHKRTFQRLPRYERRRQMSANPHLLPRNLRKAAINEIHLPQKVQQRRKRKMRKRHNKRRSDWEAFKSDTSITDPLMELPLQLFDTSTGVIQQDNMVAASSVVDTDGGENKPGGSGRKREKQKETKETVGDDDDDGDELMSERITATTVGTSLKKNKRLTTHMYHAKRMHMEDMWGFRLAYKSTQKIFRVGYRFQRQHCTIHDASYHVCIQATSQQLKSMIQFLDHLMNGGSAHRAGGRYMTVESRKDVLQGRAESQFVMYHERSEIEENDRQTPMTNDSDYESDDSDDSDDSDGDFVELNCYGPVSFLFRQQKLNATTATMVDDDEDNELDQSSTTSDVMLWIHAASLPNSYQYLESVANRYQISLTYRNDLAKFELRGLHAITVINKALRINEEITLKKSRDVWNHICQYEKSAASLPRNMVLCLESNHPLSSSIQPLKQFPKKKQVEASIQKMKQAKYEPLLTIPDQLAQSAQLWSKFVMEEEPKPKLLTENNENYNELNASVMLVQKDGCQTSDGRNGFGSGFDFICSTQHAAHFFAKMAKFNGVLLLGISERNQLRLEQGLKSFPVDYPDSSAFYTEYESSHNANDSAPDDLLDILTEVIDSRDLVTSYKPGASKSNTDYLQEVQLSLPWGGNPAQYSLIYSCIDAEESEKIRTERHAVPHTNESRDVIGCMTSTTYSLLRSHAYGVGFISRNDLEAIADEQSGHKSLIVLVGNENSSHLHPTFVRYQ